LFYCFIVILGGIHCCDVIYLAAHYKSSWKQDLGFAAFNVVNGGSHADNKLAMQAILMTKLTHG
jgi:enolase